MQPDRPTPAARIGAALVFLVMVLGGLFLWIGVPLIWLWVASHMTSSTQPTIGPYLLIAVTVPLTMVVVAKLLRRLDGVHSRLTNRDIALRVHLPWLKSMRGERTSVRQTTALDLIMLVTAVIAMIALTVWFLGFAGSPLPNS